jgi:folylpolyglutamate synthase/dihydropteroate synthase
VRRLVATRSRGARGREPAEIVAAAARRGWSAESVEGVAPACRRALAWAPTDLPVLITGSLFAVGEAMEAFGGAPAEIQ